MGDREETNGALIARRKESINHLIENFRHAPVAGLVMRRAVDNLRQQASITLSFGSAS